MLNRFESVTNPAFGFNPVERPINEYLKYGFIVLDKPSGPTSHQVTHDVRKLLGSTKTGHSGTLDPKVTGVLPIALSKSTKVIEFLLTAGKEYICLAYIHKDVSEEKIRSVLNNFKGDINQLVPKRSSVKRQVRKRTVYDLEILDVVGRNVLFRVSTQAGTYIRKLVHDFGEALETGAHMKELRRTRAGLFTESKSFRYDELLFAKKKLDAGDESFIRQVVVPVELTLPHLKRVYISDGAVSNVCNGSPVYTAGVVKLDEGIERDNVIRILTLKEELVGVGKASMSSEDMVNSAKGVAVRTQKVVMEFGLYPPRSEVVKP